jgi:Uma2 family endonuclease
MAIDTHTLELRLVRHTDALEVDLLPLQGIWTAEQYLRLTDQTRHLIEFADGVIEVLPMPTERHQAMVEFLFFRLRGLVEQLGGKARFAPLRLQIRPGMFRAPDILLLRDANDPRRQNRFWLGADLVMEIVSPDDPERDTLVKRADYAAAGIPEYWIVNLDAETIAVLALNGAAYREAGVYRRGDIAVSVLLDGFAVAVGDVLDAR